MPDTITPKKQSAESLLALFEAADKITVEELTDNPAKGRGKPAAGRAFLVYVKPSVKPAPESHDREFLLRNAEVLLAAEEWLLARHVYSLLLQRDIRDPDGLKGLGICLFRVGDRKSARKCFTALWDVHRRDDALLWLGLCYASGGETEKAVACYRRVREPRRLSDAERFELWKDLGNCLARMERLDEAEAAYRDALAVKPDSAALRVNFGMLDLQRDRVSAARGHFSKAVELDPGSAKAHCGLGLVSCLEGDYAAAEERFARAMELDPSGQTPLLQWLSIGHRLGATERLHKAVAAFLEKDAGNVEVRYAHAALLFQESRWTDCRRALDAVLSAAPAHGKATRLRDALERATRSA